MPGSRIDRAFLTAVVAALQRHAGSWLFAVRQDRRADPLAVSVEDGDGLTGHVADSDDAILSRQNLRGGCQAVEQRHIAPATGPSSDASSGEKLEIFECLIKPGFPVF